MSVGTGSDPEASRGAFRVNPMPLSPYPRRISCAKDALLSPGIYWMQAFNAEITQPQPIPRVGGRDPYGVLYIGRTDGSGKKRLELVWRAFNEGTTKHGAAGEYIASGLNKLLPNWQITFWHVPTIHKPYDCRYHESALLVAYRACFREYPPLNIGRPETTNLLTIPCRNGLGTIRARYGGGYGVDFGNYPHYALEQFTDRTLIEY